MPGQRHAAGGVHYDPGNIKGNREAVNALHKALIVGGFGAVLYAVLAIGRVSLTALQPLADAVIKDTK
jgi:hypothetical protein